MSLVIGCPLRSREWIIRKWFLAVEEACHYAGISDPSYVFVMANGDPTGPVLTEVAARHGRELHLLDAGERVERDDRSWNWRRYRHMTLIRNFVLSKVREIAPDYFLSLDSDVLLHEQAIANLIQTHGSHDFDAVGGKTWMSEARDCCSYLQLVNSAGWTLRPDVTDVIPVDVIMAIKLMSPRAYRVDYRFDPLGEDVGWARAVTEAGLRLGFDGRVCSKHVMTRADLDHLDVRAGF